MPWIFSTTKSEQKHKLKHMFFGVELEILYPDDKVDTLTDDLPRTVESGTDCSIRGKGYQLELRFHPATFRYWVEHRTEYESLLNRMTQDGAKSNTQQRCGLHIHFDNSLSKEHTTNFLHFIYANNNYMQSFSRRTPTHSFDYAGLHPQTYYRSDTCAGVRCGEYAINCSACKRKRYEAGDTTVTKIDGSAPEGMFSWSNGKHAAVNIYHQTVELRLFAGTLETTEFYMGLQFCEALIRFTNPKRYNWQRDCSVTKLRVWLDNKKKYSDLITVMNTPELLALESQHA